MRRSLIAAMMLAILMVALISVTKGVFNPQGGTADLGAVVTIALAVISLILTNRKKEPSTTGTGNGQR